jgi:hypothetical protein
MEPWLWMWLATMKIASSQRDINMKRLSSLLLILMLGCAHSVKKSLPLIEISSDELATANYRVAFILKHLPAYTEDETMAQYEVDEIAAVEKDLDSLDGFKGKAFIDATKQLESDWVALVSLDNDLESLYVL